MRFKYNKVDFLAILSIFLVGFLIRVINLRYIVQLDEHRWIFRGPMFIESLASLNVSKIFFTYHPGVTTMYISGLVQLFLPANLDVLTFVRLPFCVFGAATCVLVYLMGKSMFNKEQGIIAAVMLTFEPFYIGITRIIHLDGLLSFFFTLTLYFFWLGTTQQKQKYIILSGISLGLAALTKTSTVLLVPVLIIWAFLLKNKAELNSRQAMWLVLKITLIGGLLFLALWPGIWNLCTSNRANTLAYLIEKYTEHYQGHELPTFFLGSTSWPNSSAPFYFYPIILLIRLSTGVLIFFILSTVLYVNKLRKRRAVLEETLFFVVIVIFVFGLSMIGKKADRYLIPIWPMLMVIASNGFQTILNSTRTWFTSIGSLKNKRIAPPVILGFVVVFPTAFWIVNYQPFYVFYFNDFVGGLRGGSQITVTYTSEGNRLVAEYLSTKSNDLVVASAYSDNFLEYFYEGNVTSLPETLTILFDQYDYVVFHLTFVQRYSDNIIWQYFKEKTPEFVVVVQDVIVVWVFNVEKTSISFLQGA